MKNTYIPKIVTYRLIINPNNPSAYIRNKYDSNIVIFDMIDVNKNGRGVIL